MTLEFMLKCKYLPRIFVVTICCHFVYIIDILKTASIEKILDLFYDLREQSLAKKPASYLRCH